MKVNVFGSTSFTGTAFIEALVEWDGCSGVFSYSRDFLCSNQLDMSLAKDFSPASGLDPSVWVAFAPIWIFAPFFSDFARDKNNLPSLVNGVIACSSSSALTKRFAANDFDRALVARLISAEDQLLATCRRLDVPCRILRPSLIYGQIGPYGDRNLSRLLALMRRLPLVLLPSLSGLRQPIHASQLAAVALQLAQQMLGPGLDPALPERIALGGDSQISYKAMLQALQQALPANDPARHCRICEIPNRLFFLLAAPLLLRSPKAFEAVLRIGADLAGFTPSHQLLNQPPQPFPVLPLAL